MENPARSLHFKRTFASNRDGVAATVIISLDYAYLPSGKNIFCEGVLDENFSIDVGIEIAWDFNRRAFHRCSSSCARTYPNDFANQTALEKNNKSR